MVVVLAIDEVEAAVGYQATVLARSSRSPKKVSRPRRPWAPKAVSPRRRELTARPLRRPHTFPFFLCSPLSPFFPPQAGRSTCHVPLPIQTTSLMHVLLNMMPLVRRPVVQ